jgi:hypothetical protein
VVVVGWGGWTRPDRLAGGLSGLTQIMSQANGGAIGGMAARFGLVEQGGGGSPESFPIGPQAMAGQLLREEAPDALQLD